MAMIGDKERAQIQELFEERLREPVRLLMFTQEHECEFCSQTRELVEEIASVSDSLGAEIYDFVEDGEVVDEYAIDKIPAIAVIGERDYGVRFYGIPSGYEFTTLVEGIVNVSRGEANLSETSVVAIEGISVPVQLQVFVTPT